MSDCGSCGGDVPPVSEGSQGSQGSQGSVPVVGPSVRLAEAVRYLERFAEEIGMDYVKLLVAVEEFLGDGSYVHVGFSGPDAGDEFWDAFELVSGRVVEEPKRESFFTCSC